MSKRKASNKVSKSVKKNATVYGPMDRFVKRNGIINISDDSKEQSCSSTCSTLIQSNANLCGETDLDSVISLVREWVQTEPDLMDEDVAYLMRYLLNLVEDKSIDTLTAVIKAYYKAVLQRNDQQWKDGYNGIITLIQSDLSSMKVPVKIDFDIFKENG